VDLLPPNSLDPPKSLFRRKGFWVILGVLLVMFLIGRLNSLPFGYPDVDAPAATIRPLEGNSSPAGARTAGQSSNYRPPTNFSNISSWVASETNCDFLQSWFNGAANMHDRASDAGDLPAMRWYTDLMRRIDTRLERVGCYG
jgi:hypothetical protein